MKTTYYATREGWISGVHYLEDAEVRMTEKQAEYYLLDGILSTEKPKKAVAVKSKTAG